ncbi:MAG: (d)CMP kinase [Clostridia bacterium]|nr:(d)CMP kinase [Clostridia bacterium]
MLNIAIDGPSGSGKSTVADALAAKLDILHLDTGAMYRACALAALKRNVDCFDEGAIALFINDIDLKISYKNGKQVTILDGEDVSERIRDNEVSLMASNISSLGVVRTKMVEMQRAVAKENDCILDGRDIGTVVLPDVKHKFFLTATAEIRAERRFKELTDKGQSVDMSVLLEEINKRDYNDSHRKIAPLHPAPDSVIIDSSSLTVDEVVERIITCIKSKT